MMMSTARGIPACALRVPVRPLPVLAAIGAAAMCTEAVLQCDDRFSLISDGDAAAHLVRTRQFIDSLHPGLENIGTVWLPLFLEQRESPMADADHSPLLCAPLMNRGSLGPDLPPSNLSSPPASFSL